MISFTNTLLALFTAASTVTAFCTVTHPPIKDANTVTFDLRAANDCCDAPFKRMSLGVLDVCHTTETANQPTFGSLAMAVGQNMFGRNIKVWVFEDANCQSGGRWYDLSNQYNCPYVPNDNARSIMISGRPTSKMIRGLPRRSENESGDVAGQT